MCFYLLQRKRYPRPKTAKKDIVCYKTMNLNSKQCISSILFNDVEIAIDKFVPVYYKFNRTYNAKDYKGKVIRKFECHALTSFDDEDDCKIFDYAIFEGFHSWKNGGGYYNIKCVIPKGAKYFENESEFVSTKIKFLEVIK